MFGVILLGIIILFVSIYNLGKDKENELKNKIYRPQYLGGFKSVSSSKSCLVTIYEDKIKIYIHGRYANIMKQDILDVMIKNENQIKEQISLGKLICFGVLAFGMRGKSKVITKDYVVLKIIYNEEELSLIFNFENSQITMKFIEDIFKIIKFDNY
ncbi:hypothetical protein FDB24_10730 [Clostridium botulinum]|uniref:hypothetical protein n=1 Tax=Clostridium botulinum TaxID=1491 RepID=UPI000773C199|nr:hypothetical protein [Clostridium botulinum]NFL87398.1 hypothetical protein [Clostridium botulinum]NFO21735.1 hypothetical protein [Clostridium botulinum]